MRRIHNYGIVFDVFGKVPSSEIEILETTTVGGVPKAIFKVRLQTAEEQNSNGRWYDKDICREIVETLRPKAKGRSLFQEVDHPMVASGGANDDFARKRAITVELKNCGTLIRDIYMKDNDIIGEVETLSGFLGPDIYNLIMYDKADIGYSLRMFGRVQMEESTGVAKVARPIRPITYDTVTNPSHKTARILEFLPESISSFLTDTKVNTQLLQEGSLFEDKLGLYDFNESVYDYLDNVIRDTFRSIGCVEFKIGR